jgi:hypothetical protein
VSVPSGAMAIGANDGQSEAVVVVDAGAVESLEGLDEAVACSTKRYPVADWRSNPPSQ